MKPDIWKFLDKYTTRETIDAAKQVLAETKETPTQHATRMALSGQTASVVDCAVLALRTGDLKIYQAAELMAMSERMSAKFNANFSSNSHQQEAKEATKRARQLDKIAKAHIASTVSICNPRPH